MTDSDDKDRPSMEEMHGAPMGMGRMFQVDPDKIRSGTLHPGVISSERVIFAGERTISIHDDGVRVTHGNGQGFDLEISEQGRAVAGIIINALIKFLEKNNGYGNTGYVLGAKGQYADMNRKMGKLKHTLWDGNEAVGESIEEMLQDLIGHAGLTIDYIKKEKA